MAVGYVSYAAPVATNPSSLGITSPAQPRTTSSTPTGGGNAAVATGFNPTPVPVMGGGTTGGASASVAALANSLAPAAMASGQATTGGSALTQAQQTQAVTAAANIATQQLQSAQASSGGGAIGDALTKGVSGIVAFAQKGMADIQKAIQGDMAANNGEVDPAKMQLYTMKMSTYELLNQMAAKIQEKEERSIQVWLR